jgi:hypothetical protein
MPLGGNTKNGKGFKACGQAGRGQGFRGMVLEKNHAVPERGNLSIT